MTAVIRVDYREMSQTMTEMHSEADAISHMADQINASVQDLHSSKWRGRGADEFFGEMENVVLPGLKRLSAALEHGSEVIGDIQRIFQQADQAVAMLFRNREPQDGSLAGGAGADAGDLSSIQRVWNELLSIAHGGQGVPVDITMYKNGVDGWSTISMDGSKGFTSDQLLSQVGSTCSIYAPLNLLVESGYKIPQAQADAIAKRTVQEAGWRFDTWVYNGDPRWGYGIDVSRGVVGKLTAGYQSGDFVSQAAVYNAGLSSGVIPDSARADRFLVNSLQSGKPVMVMMGVDNSFGLGSAGHDATVIGVKTDASGNLQNVLVATNWGSQPVYEMPANTFLHDWLTYSNGKYITVDHAPVAPQP